MDGGEREAGAERETTPGAAPDSGTANERTEPEAGTARPARPEPPANPEAVTAPEETDETGQPDTTGTVGKPAKAPKEPAAPAVPAEPLPAVVAPLPATGTPAEPGIGPDPAEYGDYQRPSLWQVVRAADTVSIAALVLAMVSLVGSRSLETASLSLVSLDNQQDSHGALLYYLGAATGQFLLAGLAGALGLAVLRRAYEDERDWMFPVAGAAVLLAVVSIALLLFGAVAVGSVPIPEDPSR